MRWPLAALAIVVMGTVACSGSTAGTQSSAGGCGSSGKPNYLASAKVAFTGTMLPGPAMSSGMLLSPAKVRVTRYLKGHGPAVVTVRTGYTRNDGGGTANGEDITPRFGERWTIYATSDRMPYATSVCAGSARDR